AFWDSKLINDPGHDDTPGQFGSGGAIVTIPTLLFALGIIAGGILLARKVKGALLYTILGLTVVAIIIEAIWKFGSLSSNEGGWALVVPTLDQNWSFVPDLSLIGQVSVFGAFTSGPAIVTILLLIF